MNPRPLYRWKSFWLGVGVLVFFAMPWDSVLRGGKLGGFKIGQSSYTVVRGPGATFLGVSRPHNVSHTTYTAGGARMSIMCGVSGREFPVPDAAVLVPFIVLWGGWMAWRWRKVKRWGSVE